jgi:hypothetical protein
MFLVVLCFHMLSLTTIWCLHFPTIAEEIVVEGLTYTHYLMIKTIAKRLVAEQAMLQSVRGDVRASRLSLLLSLSCNRFGVLQDS